MEEGTLAEVDCSKTYSQGQAFQVVYGDFNTYSIIFKGGGLLPDSLAGRYTSVSKAVSAITLHMKIREDHFEKVARKKAAKRTPKNFKES